MAWRWFRAIRRRVREHLELAVECAALRRQVASCSAQDRDIRGSVDDRLLWAVLSRYWPRWREALVLVQAETVLHWDRQRGVRVRLLPRFRRRRRGWGSPKLPAPAVPEGQPGRRGRTRQTEHRRSAPNPSEACCQGRTERRACRTVRPARPACRVRHNCLSQRCAGRRDHGSYPASEPNHDAGYVRRAKLSRESPAGKLGL